MQVPNDMRDFVTDRVEHAGRIFDDGGDVDVEFTVSNNPRRANGRFRVEITTNTAGRIVRVEAEAAEERTAVDLASDRYERQLRKLKTKLIQRNRVSNKDLNHVSSQSDEDDDRGVEIVRTKRFSMKPMSAEEERKLRCRWICSDTSSSSSSMRTRTGTVLCTGDATAT